MNNTLISIIENKHKIISDNSNDQKLDPVLLNAEIGELKEVNKWLRQELEVKDNKLKELNDKIDSLKYLNEQYCIDNLNSEGKATKKNSDFETNSRGISSFRILKKNSDSEITYKNQLRS